MDIDFSKIKLVIWDLDETLWNGILSEGTVQFVEENIQLIRDLTDAGVVNSICSKNDPDKVDEALKKMGIDDLFVFKSITWTSKGSRVKQIISEMNLREPNVLFIDDNTTNLGEVESCCPKIMAATDKFIPELIRYYSAAPKKDLEHKRLEQYKVLERKEEFKATTESNLDFLRKCGIQVSMDSDCKPYLDRIEELVHRANQLNFTKVRSSEEELREVLQDSEIKKGIVRVKDNFGDYGIVGFYALQDNRLLHFVFSCRTLNMGVEQYVYHALGKPEITVVGEVSSELTGTCPDWINRTEEGKAEKKTAIKHKVVIKGPCDLQQVFSFIKLSPNIIDEFSYVNSKGVLIEQGNHTTHIVESLTLPQEQKDYLAKSLPFGDKGMFQTRMFDQDVKVVVLSMFMDPNLGLYREKKTNAVVAFGEYTNDLTNTDHWEKIIAGEVFTANCKFTQSDLRNMAENYEFLGRINVDSTVQNLSFIYEHICQDAILILCLGSELPYLKNTQEAYEGRHLYHSELNCAIRTWAKDKSNVFLLDVNHYVQSQDDFTNNINHFQKNIYYQLCVELLRIIEENSEEKVLLASEFGKKFKTIVRKVSKIPLKIKTFLNH